MVKVKNIFLQQVRFFRVITELNSKCQILSSSVATAGRGRVTVWASSPNEDAATQRTTTQRNKQIVASKMIPLPKEGMTVTALTSHHHTTVSAVVG